MRAQALAGASALALVSSLAFAAPPRRVRGATRDYRAAMAKVHEAEPGAKPVLDARGRPKLVLVSLASERRVELEAGEDRGGFSAEALDAAQRVLGDPRTGLTHPVEPMLLDLVYRAMRAFSAHEVRIVSGYRVPKPKGASNHGRGRAMDLVLPGVPDKKLAEWGREQGGVGVGIYPTSGFVHLDVRPQSYFWVDASGPGQRGREVPLRGGSAAKADAAAAKRGDTRIAPFVLPGRLADADRHPHEAEGSGEDDGESP